MRTTLTLDPDVAQKVRRRMSQKKLTLKQVINEALRAGLSSTQEEKEVPYKVEPYPFEFKPGIDTDKLNQLLDELEVEDFRRKMRR